MNCTTERHLYDVSEDGQSARCLCGKGDPIDVPPYPEWAVEAVDMVDLDEWVGRIDDDDLEIGWTAEVYDSLFDGSHESWEIPAGDDVMLDAGDLQLRWSRWSGDGLGVADAMRRLRLAVLAF